MENRNNHNRRIKKMPDYLIIFLVSLPIIALLVHVYYQMNSVLDELIASRRQSLAGLVVSVVEDRLKNATFVNNAAAENPLLTDRIEAGNWQGAIDAIRQVPDNFSIIDRIF